MIFKRATSVVVATVIAGAALTAVHMTSLHADCAFIDRYETLQLELLDVSVNGESIDLPTDAADQDFFAVATNRWSSDGRNYFSMTLYDRHTEGSHSVEMKPFGEDLPEELEAYLSDGE